ncbi:MAG: 3-deoxy-D-manno-octulosonic acid transferase, partial [Candidatus Ratteibacteria bacterium]|nr:3-deoxy-D-manno-octulosonic acid transferase [Candidatus Ratteibacteria bacterium]
LATVVFVGGSLIPKGGQNILEPINFGKPVVLGPYINKFKENSELLLNSGIGFRIQSEDEFYQKMLSFLKDEKLRGDIEDKADLIVARHRGASFKNFELIKRCLPR